MDEVKYPNITVKLVGEDGNAFAVPRTVKKALKKADVPQDEIDKFLTEAMAGDYNNFLVVCMTWVNAE